MKTLAVLFNDLLSLSTSSFAEGSFHEGKAKKRDARAQFNLGLRYAICTGVVKDEVEV